MKLIFSLFALFLVSGCTEMEYASHLAKRVWSNDENGRTVNYDAATMQQVTGDFKIGKPYKVEGRWYYPKEEYDLTETGIISWYGPGFHGKRTANGEVFDTNELTAAHRTLQMPSLVRVTNLENGRSVIVRVNDRGPYKRGRIMDVSERAADLLGFKVNGTAKARIQVLKQESLQLAQMAKTGQSTRGYEIAMNGGGGMTPPVPETSYADASYQPSSFETASVEAVQRETLVSPPPAGAGGMTTALPGHLREGQFFPDPVITEYPVSPSHIYVQAGSFSVYNNALRHRERLAAYNAAVQQAEVNGRPFFRVRIGPVGNVEEADELLARLINEGFGDTVIVVD